MWETSFKPTQKNRWSYVLHIFIFTILEAEEKTKDSDLNNSKFSPIYDATKLKWSLRSDTSLWEWKSMVFYFSSVKSCMTDRRLCREAVHVSDFPLDRLGRTWAPLSWPVYDRLDIAWVLQLLHERLNSVCVCGCLHERLNTVWVPPSLPLDAMALKLYCPLLSVLTEGALCDCYGTDIRNE